MAGVKGRSVRAINAHHHRMRTDKTYREWFENNGHLQDWQVEMAMDLADVSTRDMQPDKYGTFMPLADFECEHGRLPSDRSAHCGCWPTEELGLTA